MPKAMLYDATRCIGCRACQVACKSWNELPAEKTTNRGTCENPPALSASTFTKLRFRELEYNGRFQWVFAKIQCMHCLHPACVEACLVGALQKLEDGPVVYDEGKCVGCRYCMVACPFDVPTFEWDKPIPWIRKCTFCLDRQQADMKPACAKACPTEALRFGERDELLTEARKRLVAGPDKYYQHIYGEKEAGGTSWLYLSPVPFEELYFPTLGDAPVTVNVERAMSAVAPVLLTVACLMSGVYWVARRREKIDTALSKGEKRGESR